MIDKTWLNLAAECGIALATWGLYLGDHRQLEVGGGRRGCWRETVEGSGGGKMEISPPSVAVWSLLVHTILDPATEQGCSGERSSWLAWPGSGFNSCGSVNTLWKYGVGSSSAWRFSSQDALASEAVQFLLVAAPALEIVEAGFAAGEVADHRVLPIGQLHHQSGDLAAEELQQYRGQARADPAADRQPVPRRHRGFRF